MHLQRTHHVHRKAHAAQNSRHGQPGPCLLQSRRTGLKKHQATQARQQASTKSTASRWAQQLASLATAATCSLSLLLAQPCAGEELSFSFPASGNPEIRAAQKTLVESWAYLDTLYVDPPDHTTWGKALQDALAASFKAANAGEVTQLTRDLLAKLDDPYTRLLQEEEDAALAAEEEGKIVATGLGLQQLTLQSPAAPDAGSAASRSGAGADAQQQVLVVSFVVEDSPAAQAGVKEGDAVLSVAGQAVSGKELRDIYKLLAKEADVTLARQPPLPGADSTGSGSSDSSSSSSGGSATSVWDVTDAAAAGLFSASAGDATAADGVLQGVETYTVHLKPMPLEFEPAQYGIVDLGKLSSTSDSTAASLVSTSSDGQTANNPTVGSSSSSSTGSPTGRSSRVGYLKVLTFSATAPQAVAEALLDIQKEAQQAEGLAGLIVDLRDNPGGIVEAGVDIAQDFLHAGETLCIAVSKTGEEERVVLPEAHTLTELPLVVLVNHSTASTSELLAGALHDELKAPLIGTTTYGKGRTQRVIRLADGQSTLLVSTLKYFTPEHTTIDNAGLQPDVVCRPEEILGQQWLGGRVGDDVGSLLDDPCIKLAAERLASAA